MTRTVHAIPQNRVVDYEKSMQIIECCTCSIDFGLGRNFIAERRQDHGTFYCPNGHPQGYYGDNEKEKLEKDLAAANRRAESNAAYAERERRSRLLAERQRAAAKGQVTKIKNRVAAGVCPCCNRTFQNLGKHMAGQHPDFAPGTGS